MTRLNEQERAFEAYFRQNENTLCRVAAHFYRPGTYRYIDLFSVLAEHLWCIFRGRDTAEPIRDESRWVGVAMFRRALDYYESALRSERRLPLDTSVDLASLLVANEEENPLIARLYYLLAHLKDDYHEFIYLYLDRVPLPEIARMLNVSYLAANRRLHRIERELCRLNEILPDNPLIQ